MCSMSETPSPASIPDRVRQLLPDLHPRKGLGQHFLVSRRVLRCILDAADLHPDDVVIEVGPGLGLLTEALARHAGRVTAVELDEALARALTRAFDGYENVAIMQGDARTIDVGQLLGPEAGAYKVVANLPYYAALPILRRFLEAERKPSLLVVMVQREVARAMVAQPGDMSILSVATQFYGVPRVACRVPPGAFSPPPRVSSAVVRIDVRGRPPVDVPSPATFFRVVRGGFAAPRKQIRNSLAQGLGIPPESARRVLERAGLDPRLRPEALTLEAWALLAWAWIREHEPASLP